MPQYIQFEEDYIGKVRLMEVLGSLYNFPRNEADIEKAKQQLERINMAVEERPELRAIIPQIETRYQAKIEKKKEDLIPLPPEMEKFLRELGSDFSQN